MPKVTFLPQNETFEAEAGESILDVALNNDVDLQHACGGFCSCATCHIIVRKGLDQVSAKDEDEVERLEMEDLTADDARLGCQTKVNGDCTIEMINID